MGSKGSPGEQLVCTDRVLGARARVGGCLATGWRFKSQLSDRAVTHRRLDAGLVQRPRDSSSDLL